MGRTSISQKNYGQQLTTLAQINVTPLVDVILVLLIIFMISAPLMQNGVSVELPKTGTTTLKESREPLILVVTRTQQMILNDQLIPSGSLLQRIQSAIQANPGIEILVHADQGISYGVVMQIMAQLKKAGIARVGLVTEPSEMKIKF